MLSFAAWCGAMMLLVHRQDLAKKRRPSQAAPPFSAALSEPGQPSDGTDELARPVPLGQVPGCGKLVRPRV